MWSQNCMKRLIFQLVLQLTEFTWGAREHGHDAWMGKKGKKTRQAVTARPCRGSPASLYLLAASVVSKLVVAGVQRLPGVDRVQDDFVSHNYLGRKMGKEGWRMRPGRRALAGSTHSAFCTASLRTFQPCTHVISVAPQLPEGLDEEPGSLVAGGIQCHPHGVLLKQGWQSLVHCQVLIALHVEELEAHMLG